MLVRSRWASSVIDCRAYNGLKQGMNMARIMQWFEVAYVYA